jgi:hypothetical protein
VPEFPQRYVPVRADNDVVENLDPQELAAAE